MESNEQSSGIATQGSRVSSISPRLLGWGVAALVLSIFMCTHNNSAMVLGAGTGAKVFAVLVGTVLSWIGALLGDAVRRFVHPDSVYTTGGFFHLLWIRVFWLLGPQVIGLAVGSALGLSMVLK